MNLPLTSWPLAVAAAAFMCCAPASAQFRGAAEAIDYRQGTLTVMNVHFRRIGAMASGKMPYDARIAQADADLVVTLARLPWSAFVDDSGDGDTNARPEVWSQPGKFKAASLRLEQATVKLAEAARTGRPEPLETAFDEAAHACQACHDDFRKKH